MGTHIFCIQLRTLATSEVIISSTNKWTYCMIGMMKWPLSWDNQLYWWDKKQQTHMTWSLMLWLRTEGMLGKERSYMVQSFTELPPPPPPPPPAFKHCITFWLSALHSTDCFFFFKNNNNPALRCFSHCTNQTALKQAAQRWTEQADQFGYNSLAQSISPLQSCQQNI